MPITINQADFSDIDVPVFADLVEGVATRETGFSTSVVDVPFRSLTTDQSPADFLAEAIAGNLYFDIHTTNVPSGEIRGHLIVQSDETEDRVRTITLQAQLDSAQEPGEVIGGRVPVWKSSVIAAMADVSPKYYSQKSHCNKIYDSNHYCNK